MDIILNVHINIIVYVWNGMSSTNWKVRDRLYWPSFDLLFKVKKVIGSVVFHNSLLIHSQLVKVHNAVIFQMLPCVVTYDEKWPNLPTFVILNKVVRCTNIFLTRYYETLESPPKLICVVSVIIVHKLLWLLCASRAVFTISKSQTSLTVSLHDLFELW